MQHGKLYFCLSVITRLGLGLSQVEHVCILSSTQVRTCLSSKQEPFLCFGEKHLGLGLSVGPSVFKTSLAAGLPVCMPTENFESKFVMAVCVVWWWCVFYYR